LFPGQHGAKRRRRPSDFALQLREKQKVKRMYGILERQFRRYFEKARQHRGETGKVLLQMLERRLDNVVYRLGLARSRAQARQIVCQGKIAVNDRTVTAPSFGLSVGDKIAFTGKDLESRKDLMVPSWLSLDTSQRGGQVKAEPSREDIDQDIDETLIVEYYLR
jgi:small subunit ribosomal protein S4